MSKSNTVYLQGRMSKPLHCPFCGKWIPYLTYEIDFGDVLVTQVFCWQREDEPCLTRGSWDE